MTITELIKQLEKARAKHGDMEIKSRNFYNELTYAASIRIERPYPGAKKIMIIEG